MAQTVALSDFNNTLELFSIVDDRQENIIQSATTFDRILEDFFKNLSDDDKQLAINYLYSVFPNHAILKNQQQQLNKSKSSIYKSLNMLGFKDYGFKKNIKIFKLYMELNNVRLNEDWKKLNDLLEQKEYFENNILPISMMQYRGIFEKLKLHSFKIIDLIESFRYGALQLNSSILKNLVFFFFPPDHLQLNSKEQINIYILLGEILCECWVQFEYHVQQLESQGQNSNQLKILNEIPKLSECDLQNIQDSMQQLFRVLLKKTDQTFVDLTEIDQLIERILPINFDLQVVFYQMCFFCFQQFYYQQQKQINKIEQKEKYLLLNSYIQQKNKSKQIDKEVRDKLEQYTLEQTKYQFELKNLQIKSFETLLALIIEEDFYKLQKAIHIMNINNKNELNAKLMNLLTEIPEVDKRKVATLIQQLIKEENIIKIVLRLQKLKQEYPIQEVEIILRIISEQQNQNFKNYQILKTALKENTTQVEMEYLKQISQYDENMELEDQIKILKGFQDDLWEFIKKHHISNDISNSLISKYLDKTPEDSTQVLQILRRLCQANCSVQPISHQKKLFTQLFIALKDDQIHELIYDIRSNQIQEKIYERKIQILHQFLQSLQTQNENEYLDLARDLEEILKLPKFFCFNYLIDLMKNKLEEVQTIYKLIYSWQFQQKQDLKNNAEMLYRNNADFYKQNFAKINFFDNDKLHPVQLELQLKSDIYPRSLNISLEKFNISLTLLDKIEQQELVANWIKNVKDQKAFEQLIPFFFNIIKRGESSASFLSIINQKIRAEKELQLKYGYFNQKSIFQIFYNNANEELKVMLLKLMSKQYPIPLLYRTPYNPITQESEKLTFNINSFYVFQQNFPIINLSLDENQKRIGKTELINRIFYQQYKFEISDNNQLNRQTIDIMYDFEFSGSRDLSIADAHNFIPLEILDDILPIFRMWIIQLDTETEIDKTIQILQKLDTFKNKNKMVCFLIRNSKQDLDENQIKQLQQFNIEWKQVIDLSDNDLNKQMKDEEIEQVSKFLFEIIDIQRKQLSLKQEEYFSLICQMKHQDLSQIKEMANAQKLFKEIENELNTQMEHEQGFYNEAAFPLRSIDWQIKQEKDKYTKLQQNNEQKDYMALNQIKKIYHNYMIKLSLYKFQHFYQNFVIC